MQYFHLPFIGQFPLVSTLYCPWLAARSPDRFDFSPCLPGGWTSPACPGDVPSKSHFPVCHPAHAKHRAGANGEQLEMARIRLLLLFHNPFPDSVMRNKLRPG